VIRSYSLNAVGSLRGERGSRLSSGVDSGVLARTPEFASEPSRRLGSKLVIFRLSSPVTTHLSATSSRGRNYAEYTIDLVAGGQSSWVPYL
jgi:hypothetical protein